MNKPILTAGSDNLHLWRLGANAELACDPKQQVGDFIDRGLILLRLLNEAGYDVVERENRQGN